MTEREFTDQELMQNYKNGDLQAFNEIYNRYSGRLYQYLIKRVQNPHLAEELFQCVFTKIHQFRFSYDGKREFAPWFFKVAQNSLFDYFKCAHNKQEFDEFQDSTTKNYGHNEENEHSQFEWYDFIHTLSLSENEKKLLLLKYFEDNDYESLSKSLKMKSSTLRKMVERTLSKCKKNSLFNLVKNN